MTHLRITSPAIEAIDKKIAALKAERKLKVSEAAGAKAQALCAEMAAAKKARK
jgi:chorismate mutase